MTDFAKFLDAVESVAEFYQTGGKEPWPDARLSAWLLITKALPALRKCSVVEWRDAGEKPVGNGHYYCIVEDPQVGTHPDRVLWSGEWLIERYGMKVIRWAELPKPEGE